MSVTKSQSNEADISVEATPVESVEQDAPEAVAVAQPDAAALPVSASVSSVNSAASQDGANFFCNPSEAMLQQTKSMATGGVLFIQASHPTGKFVVHKKITAGEILGEVHLDLSRADFVHPVTTISTGAILAELKVTVPRGVRVETQGLGILGSFKGLATQNTNAGEYDKSPLVIVRGTAILGSVKVSVNEDCPRLNVVE